MTFWNGSSSFNSSTFSLLPQWVVQAEVEVRANPALRRVFLTALLLGPVILNMRRQFFFLLRGSTRSSGSKFIRSPQCSPGIPVDARPALLVLSVVAAVEAEPTGDAHAAAADGEGGGGSTGELAEGPNDCRELDTLGDNIVAAVHGEGKLCAHHRTRVIRRRLRARAEGFACRGCDVRDWGVIRTRIRRRKQQSQGSTAARGRAREAPQQGGLNGERPGHTAATALDERLQLKDDASDSWRFGRQNSAVILRQSATLH